MAWTARARALLVAIAVAFVPMISAVPALAEPASGAPGPDPAMYTPPFSLAFPLEGRHGFSDTFGAIRDGGSRLHQGNDIGAPKGTPILAAADGVITRIDTGKKAGLWVEITHADGWTTRYLHLNNDEPLPPPAPPPPSDDTAAAAATTGDTVADDGSKDETAASADAVAVEEEPAAMEAEAPLEPDPTWGIPEGVGVGTKVAVGDIVGFVGTSGNAARTAPHLHFEIRMPDGTPVNPYPLLTGKATATTLYVLPEITDEPVTSAVDVMSHIDPGEGFNAAVRVHDGVAYLGTYGNETVCPATGVRRYDVSDPQSPIELAPISAGYPGTSTEAIWVGAVDTSGFSGDLAVIAHRLCDSADDEAFRGFGVYDVTDPAAPALLGSYESGAWTIGVTGLDVWVRDNRVLVVAAVPNSLLNHPDAVGDVRIVDITIPWEPIEIADWDFRRDAPGTMREAVLDGSDPATLNAYGITVDPAAERVFVSNWDAGVTVLDISEPSRPTLIGRDASMGYQEGKTSLTAYDAERRILIVAHRDLDPLEGVTGIPSWGISVLFDAAGDENPTLISTYTVDDARADVDGRLQLSGLYAANDAVVSGGYLYAAWLSGGLTIVDLSDPGKPVQAGSFIPPTRVDPQRQFTSPNGNIAMPLAWSVHVVDNLIYLSDANTGLWILRLSDPPIGTD